MSNNLDIDFDIDNYNIEEIIAVTNMNDLPLNRGKIIEQINHLNNKFRKYPKYLIFFKKAREKLLKHLKDINEETWKEAYEHDDSIASQVLTNQYISEKKESNNSLLIDNIRNVIARKRKSMENNYATISTTQGTKNPVAINTIKRIVNLDSHYRQILDVSSCQCIDESEICGSIANKEERLYTSTNYTVNLNQTLTNVLDLTLESVEIPNSWYTFSSDYGTNSIRFKSNDFGNGDWDELIIDISNGNYTGQEMEDALNVILAGIDFEDVIFSNAISDGFDGDAVTGRIERASFLDIGGDGIDISASEIVGTQLVFVQIKDKAVSVGEASRAELVDVFVKGAGIGIASKDLSFVTVEGADFEQIANFALASYQKKPEYGPSTIKAYISESENDTERFVAEGDSVLWVNWKLLESESLDVESLYEVGILGN